MTYRFLNPLYIHVLADPHIKTKKRRNGMNETLDIPLSFHLLGKHFKVLMCG